ncbi:MAG: sigma-70 family RNA polymerase sigma factor [Microcoleus sp.]
MTTYSHRETIPILPERRTNTEVFCTYLMLDTQNGLPLIKWQNIPALKRNFELYQKHNQTFRQLLSQPNTLQSISMFWRSIIIASPPILAEWEPKNSKKLALEHLASLFEKNCYYASKKVWLNSQERSWEEYLSSARIFVYSSDSLVKVLKSYDEAQANLDTYIQQTLIKEIKNEHQICKFSQWRLVVKKSDKELRQALQRAGYQEPYISQCIFARKYFQQVYRFNKVQNPALRRLGDKWLEPDSEDFQAATECYNAEKSLSCAPHEVSAGSSISIEQMQAWMETCIEVLQKYEKIIISSSENIQNIFPITQPQDSDQLWDASELEIISLEAEESDSEANPQLHQTQLDFHEELDRLKPDQHKILLLYYGLGLKQRQLETQLGTSQSAISRRLNTIKKQLLRTLINKSQPQAWVTNYVVEWLHKDFRAPRHSDLIEAALVQATKKLTVEAKHILFRRYGQQLNEQQIASQFGLSLLDVKTIISESQEKLQAYLIKELPHWEKEYVEEWLKSFYYSLICLAHEHLNLSLEMTNDWETIDKIVEESLRILMFNKQEE